MNFTHEQLLPTTYASALKALFTVTSRAHPAEIAPVLTAALRPAADDGAR